MSASQHGCGAYSGRSETIWAKLGSSPGAIGPTTRQPHDEDARSYLWLVALKGWIQEVGGRVPTCTAHDVRFIANKYLELLREDYTRQIPARQQDTMGVTVVCCAVHISSRYLFVWSVFDLHAMATCNPIPACKQG